MQKKKALKAGSIILDVPKTVMQVLEILWVKIFGQNG